MLPAVRKTSIAALAALSLAFAGAALPANALGKNERNVLKGVAAAVIAGAILNDIKRKNRQREAESGATYYDPGYNQPVYRDPPRHERRVHRDNRREGRVVAAPAQSVYSTPAARVFNSYTPSERRQIQRQLASYGYYRGSIDGSFGPGTYRAVEAFAQRQGRADLLSSNGGVYALFDSLTL